MDKILFRFPLRAVSFQQKRIFTNRKTGKSFIGKGENDGKFQSELIKLLKDRQEDIKAFSESFNRLDSVIVSDWAFLYTDFFTKKEKTVSSNCLDLDNSIKNVQDVIFEEMGIDDKNIVKSTSFKWIAKRDEIICTFKILKIKDIQLKLPALD